MTALFFISLTFGKCKCKQTDVSIFDIFGDSHFHRFLGPSATRRGLEWCQTVSGITQEPHHRDFSRSASSELVDKFRFFRQTVADSMETAWRRLRKEQGDYPTHAEVIIARNEGLISPTDRPFSRLETKLASQEANVAG